MLTKNKLFLLDMDVTIYHEDKLIEGTKEFIDLLNSQNKDFIFLTNNSSKNLNNYVNKVNNLGLTVNKNHFYTSVQATIDYLNTLGRKDLLKIYVVGTNALKQELLENGFTLKNNSDEDVNTLIIGFDTELDYKKLTDASMLLFKGVEHYIATNPDFSCPLKNKRYIPDCGSICEMLFLTTGKRPFVIGKPRKEMIELLVKDKNLEKDEIIIVGDRIYTDITCGFNAGINTALVLTGESTLDDVVKSPIKPTFIFNSIKNIYDELNK